MAAAMGTQARVANEQGLAEEAMRLTERSLALFREVGDPWGIATTLNNLGHMLLDLNDAESALQAFREALELRQALDNPLGIAECLEAFAAAAVEHQPRRATRLLGAATALRLTTGAGQARPERDLFERTRTRAHASLSDKNFSTEWANGQAMKLEAAIELAVGSDDTPSAETSPPLAGSAAIELSAREREVAQLIAQGRSNREIAEALVVSNKTVESHVKHIFDKLGVQARAEIAVWATRRGLVPDASGLEKIRH
jgi:non-specific serine/threonine protein kinase